MHLSLQPFIPYRAHTIRLSQMAKPAHAASLLSGGARPASLPALAAAVWAGLFATVRES